MKYLISILLVLLLAAPASAVSLSNEQKGAISQNCNSIKTSLKSLQKSDSKTRVLLGTSYQTILTNFLTPLNLRLVKDNRPSSTLSSIQSDLASERNLFQSQFIAYSKDLESLIATDCQSSPDSFYEQLQATRSARRTLNKTALRLNELVQKHLSAVSALKSSSSKESQ